MNSSESRQLRKEGDSGNGPRWYTVAEASAYLGVSQPTIFRWMKQGTISFNKIGSSTRFSRENLDSVIEKSVGQKEAVASASTCASCGHRELIDGQLQGLGKLYFRPAKAKFWSLEEALVPTRCRVCAACGYVQIHADAEKARRLVNREIGTETGSHGDIPTG